uniref:Uncharacterized protein n=1 Tax=Oryza meridionalis TaxID=40149 RepID=A0A0E0E8S0_9ORYZ
MPNTSTCQMPDVSVQSWELGHGEFTVLAFLNRLSCEHCVPPAPAKDFLTFCPRTPLSREQTDACCKDAKSMEMRIVVAITTQVVFALRLTRFCIGINGLHDEAEFQINHE